MIVWFRCLFLPLNPLKVVAEQTIALLYSIQKRLVYLCIVLFEKDLQPLLVFGPSCYLFQFEVQFWGHPSLPFHILQLFRMSLLKVPPYRVYCYKQFYHVYYLIINYFCLRFLKI